LSTRGIWTTSGSLSAFPSGISRPSPGRSSYVLGASNPPLVRLRRLPPGPPFVKDAVTRLGVAPRQRAAPAGLKGPGAARARFRSVRVDSAAGFARAGRQVAATLEGVDVVTSLRHLFTGGRTILESTPGRLNSVTVRSLVHSHFDVGRGMRWVSWSRRGAIEAPGEKGGPGR